MFLPCDWGVNMHMSIGDIIHHHTNKSTSLCGDREWPYDVHSHPLQGSASLLQLEGARFFLTGPLQAQPISQVRHHYCTSRLIPTQ